MDASEQITRPSRWDEPFDADMSEEHVRRVLSLAPFDSLDPERFPKHLPLRGILMNDTRLVRLKMDEIVVREGDYGNSAYLVLEGAVRVVMDLPRAALGRLDRQKAGLLESLRRTFAVRGTRERRAHHTLRQREANENEFVVLQDVPGVLEGKDTRDIGAGQLFGELAALGRTPRTATVLSAQDGTLLLEIRWQGLRDLMSHGPELKAQIEENFREKGLNSLLRTLDIIRRLPDEAVNEIVAGTQFQRHGRMDWYGSFQQLMSATPPAERLKKEPLILEQRDYLNGLMIVRGGFVRVSRRLHQGEQTITYLGKGQHYGLEEIFAANQAPGNALVSRHSLRAVGYVDVLLIPTALVERHILPCLTSDERTRLEASIPKPHGKNGALGAVLSGEARAKLGPALLEFFMDKRAINGGAAMLIDLDRCTRCDDCVRACADTHDGNPRFIRHGDQLQGIQITQACMHCHDPICMIPCPTGAIHREESGEVVINDRTCIGCGSCANSCPYNNIQMVEIRDDRDLPQFPVRKDAQGRILRDADGSMMSSSSAGAVRRATKCDLCHDLLNGPSCVRACPHDALIRLDMRATDKLADWINR